MLAKLCKGLLVLYCCLSLSVHAATWVAVGNGDMKWTFFKLYTATLYSLDGQYREGSYPLALEIQYQRNIRASALVKATDEQWQQLGVGGEQRETWLALIRDIWPDVKKGDRLRIEVMSNGASRFLYNQAVLADIDERSFGRGFLDIWLSPKTSQPRLRQQLTGMQEL